MRGVGEVPDDRETLEPARPAPAGHSRVPALTILYHPDSARIGERARLPDLLLGASVALSRNEPAFAPPGARPGRGLDDRRISRRPIHLLRDGRADTLTLSPGYGALVVDGESIDAPRVIGRPDLDRGVVLELAQTVVLLLHEVGSDEPSGDERELVGASDALSELRRAIGRVASLDVAVLIRGETGTGKELVARAIHAASARAGGPFVSVNLAAIPAATAASELFGHKRGAFTGAVTAHDGYFARAEGGTLFLDEIGATPAEVQPMLLRALESLEIQPLGSGNTRHVDVRIVAATDADLEQAIAEGSFRAAVYHRLEGYQLFVPPLRDRRDDIGRLLVHFLRRELAALGRLDRLQQPPEGESAWLPPSFVAELARLDWPGNVRQLRNVVRHIAISSSGLPTVKSDATLSRLLGAGRGARGDQTSAIPDKAVRAPGELDDDTIRRSLREHHFHVPAAAAALGISRAALYARMRAMGLRHAKDLGRDEVVAALEACDGDVAAMARRLDVSARALSIRMRQLGLLT